MPDNRDLLGMMDELVDLLVKVKAGDRPIADALGVAAQIRFELATRGMDVDPAVKLDVPPKWMNDNEKELYRTLCLLTRAYRNAMEIFYPGFSKKSFVLAEAEKFLKTMSEEKK